MRLFQLDYAVGPTASKQAHYSLKSPMPEPTAETATPKNNYLKVS